MKSHYEKLGQYIREIDERNVEGKKENLLGVSTQKVFIESIANTVGTDFTTYKLIKRRQFAYVPDTSRRGDKIGIALLDHLDEGLISQAYSVFEVIDTKKLLPEYLMMWFRRPEFDRYARYMSYGSVREIFSWEDMCNLELPVPHPDKQMEILKEYNTIINRLELNNRLIQNLVETAQALYKRWFVDFEYPNEAFEPYKTTGGEFMESELGDIPKGWNVIPIKNICSKIGSGATPDGGKTNYKNNGISLIRSMNVHDYVFLVDDLAFIDDKQAKSLDGAKVLEKDILFNITGVSVARCCVVPKFVLPARVNQHVMIIRPKSELNLSYYTFSYLCYSDNKSKLLGIGSSGSTRDAITKTDIEKFPIIKPDKGVSDIFECHMKKVFQEIELKIQQNKLLEELCQILLSRMAILGR